MKLLFMLVGPDTRTTNTICLKTLPGVLKTEKNMWEGNSHSYRTFILHNNEDTNPMIGQLNHT